MPSPGVLFVFPVLHPRGHQQQIRRSLYITHVFPCNKKGVCVSKVLDYAARYSNDGSRLLLPGEAANIIVLRARPGRCFQWSSPPMAIEEVKAGFDSHKSVQGNEYWLPRLHSTYPTHVITVEVFQ